MTRTYGKKTRSYTVEELAEATRRIQNEEITIGDALRLFPNIPRSTLDSHVAGRINGFERGRPTILDYFQERAICNALCLLAESGFPYDNESLRDLVRNYCVEIGMDQLFNGGLPSYDWVNGFRKRWEDVITKRQPQSIEPLRAKASTIQVNEHFYSVLDQKLRQMNIFDMPDRIYNSDEIGFQCSRGRRKVFVRKGQTPHIIGGNNEKQMYTVNLSFY